MQETTEKQPLQGNHKHLYKSQESDWNVVVWMQSGAWTLTSFTSLLLCIQPHIRSILQFFNNYWLLVFAHKVLKCQNFWRSSI